MKNTYNYFSQNKLILLGLLSCVAMLTACESNYSRSLRVAYEAEVQARYDALSPEEKRQHERLLKKFRGINGLVLRLDAVTRKDYVTFTSETGRIISGPGGLHLKQVDNLTYTDNSLPVPKTVRAIWRQGDVRYNNGAWLGGTVVGDYTAGE